MAIVADSVTLEANYGWYCSIKFLNITGGGTYAFGLGTHNDPTNAKLKIVVRRPGFDNSGNATTYDHTIVGVPCIRAINIGAMRQPYPASTNTTPIPIETVSGSDLIIQVALSQRIFTEDTILSCTLDAGFYTKTGDTNNVTSLTLANGSLRSYSTLKPVVNWAVKNAFLLVGTSLHLEVTSFHQFAKLGHEIACMLFTVSDGTHTVTKTINRMSVSADSNSQISVTDGGKIVCYEADIDVSTMTDLALCTASFKAYPWIGTSLNCVDSNDGVNTFPTPLYTNLHFRIDKLGNKHGHARFLGAGGNDGTARVYGTYSSMDADPVGYATFATMVTALQAYNNANAGHNDAGGATVWIDVTGTTNISTTNGGTMTEFLVVRGKDVAQKANYLCTPTANNATHPSKIEFKNVTIACASVSWLSSGRCFGIEDCILASTSGTNLVYDMAYAYCVRGTGSYVRGFIAYSTNRANWHLIRNTKLDTYTPSIGFVVIGCSNVYWQQRGAGANTPLNDNGIYAFNFLKAYTGYQPISFGALEDIVHGMAIVQNVFIGFSTSASSPVMLLSADNTVRNTNNVMIQHNTSAGWRWNCGYNDTAADTHYHLNWSLRNNCQSGFSNKDDTFSHDSRSIGGASVGYNVGSQDNHIRWSDAEEWLGEFNGINVIYGSLASPLNPPYVLDNSYHGSNTDNDIFDYHVTLTAQAKDLTHDFCLPFDFIGHPRATGNAPGAYALFYAMLERWNGSAWVQAIHKTANGTEFIPEPVEYFDNAYWRLIKTL